MITIESLRIKYRNEQEISYKNYVFKDKQSYIILGASGSGKSTLLNMISGILLPDGGTITIDGLNVTGLSQKEKDNFRIKNIGYIYQDFKLIESMTVMDNINVLKLEHVDTSGAAAILENLGIGSKKNKKIKNLSGGEKQRVAIARALVKKPKIILADEPTGNLNYEIGRKVIEELLAYSKDSVLIVVSHDERLVGLFDNVIRMDDLIIKEENQNA